MTDEHNDACPECGEDISAVTHGLKNALEKTREERDANKASASKAKDELREATTELEDARLKLKDLPTLESLQTQLADATSKNEALIVDNADLKETASKLQDDATSGKITAAIAKAQGNVDMLSPMIKAKLAENPELDLDATIKTMRNDENFAGAFRAGSHSGGGSEPQHGNDTAHGQRRSTLADLRRSKMDDRAKIDYQKAHGFDAFMDLPL